MVVIEDHRDLVDHRLSATARANSATTAPIDAPSPQEHQRDPAPNRR